VKTSSVAAKNQPSHGPEKALTVNCIASETDEPPSSQFIVKNIDDEPPSILATGRNRFFRDIPDSSWKDWKWQFRNRITSIDQLSRLVSLSNEEQAQISMVTKRYPLAITPYYLSLINPDDPNDPVRKQAIPCIQEINMGDMGLEDPLGEKEDSVVPGMVHRYPDRVLMVLTDICPMLCRHCTRKREWRHGGWVRPESEIEAMLGYLRNNTQVRDVIISGGDPLTLSTGHLEAIISRIRQIKHIEMIRIGSRYPVVLPQRIDAELCEMLSNYGPIWLNTHFNHPNEITEESAAACDRLLRAGVPVNNQTVLLKGINDNLATQLKLSHGLLKAKVRPYYLFQCDEVQGTEHLRTSVDVGIKIIEGMRGHTSGLAVPTFVVDLVQGGGKVPLQPNYVLAMNKGELLLKNYEGKLFRYRNPDSQECKEEKVPAAAVSGVVKRLLAKGQLPLETLETKEEADADRVIVRS
jgi:lysine 2,3-aminomutase